MFQPPGRPAKTALQRAEELLARLTQDAGLWETPACSTQPQKPSSNETAPGKHVANAAVVILSCQWILSNPLPLKDATKKPGYQGI